MKLFYNIVAVIILVSSNFGLVAAQTIKLYTKTGVLKGTYTSPDLAMAAAAATDSLLFSAHSFNVKDLYLNSTIYLVYQGTISGADTTTLDANGGWYCFHNCTGTIRDIILTGSRHIPVVGNAGYAIARFNGKLAGYTTIRDCGDSLSAYTMNFQSGSIEDNVKFVNNRNPYLIVINQGSVTIKDNVEISGNYCDISLLRITVNNSDTTKKGGLKIEGNVLISKNRGGRGCIIADNGTNVHISGAAIINNQIDSSQIAIIHLENKRFLSPTPKSKANIILKDVHLYNPLSDGTRRKEVMFGDDTIKHSFSTEGCWWGNSDTTGLISIHPFHDFDMPNWAVTNWFCLPIASNVSKVLSQMRLNTTLDLPSSSLQSIEGKFTTTAGSFSFASSTINSSNIVSSDLTFPSSGSFIVTASIDADTFRPTIKELGIIEKGFEQVRIYPNPAQQVMNIQGVETGSTIQLYDVMGKMVLQKLCDSTLTKLEVEHLTKGTYTLKIITKEGNEGSAKVMKE